LGQCRLCSKVDAAFQQPRQQTDRIRRFQRLNGQMQLTVTDWTQRFQG